MDAQQLSDLRNLLIIGWALTLYLWVLLLTEKSAECPHCHQRHER